MHLIALFYALTFIVSKPAIASASCKSYFNYKEGVLRNEIKSVLLDSTRNDFKNILIEVRDFSGKIIFHYKHGVFNRQKPVAVLSASKWVSAAAIMKLVENNILKLDDKISDWIGINHDFMLPNFVSNITLKQLLSFTSGIKGEPAVFLRTDLTLEESVILLLKTLSLNSQKLDTTFNYNDNHFQVAALMALNAFEKKYGYKITWTELVQITIGQQLNFHDIDFYAKPRKKLGKLNSRPAAGLRISFDDYQKFMIMLANNGHYMGRQILKSASIEEMEAAHARTSENDQHFYGLGNWRVCSGGPCNTIENQSPGYAGWLPILNREVRFLVILGAAEENGDASPRSLALYKRLRPYILQLAKIKKDSLYD